MFDNKTQWAYETMACFINKECQMPGVEDAFAQGSYCESRYQELWDAYERLRDRLGIADEVKDVEIIINAFEDIQRELCYRMYHYGAMFGE